MDINEVARASGVPASALRYYEEKGLIASVGRRGLRRTFEPRVLERLALIALGRASGFSLEEIARMFAPDGRPQIATGPETFAKLGEGDKLAIVGRSRLDAYNRGEISLGDMVRDTEHHRWGAGKRKATLVELGVS